MFGLLYVDLCYYEQLKNKNKTIFDKKQIRVNDSDIVEYLNEKFLEHKEVVKGLSNMSVYYRLSKIETIMGEKATTAFELEQETTGWKLKTICPYCGIKLGDH